MSVEKNVAEEVFETHKALFSDEVFANARLRYYQAAALFKDLLKAQHEACVQTEKNLEEKKTWRDRLTGSTPVKLAIEETRLLHHAYMTEAVNMVSDRLAPLISPREGYSAERTASHFASELAQECQTAFLHHTRSPYVTFPLEMPKTRFLTNPEHQGLVLEKGKAGFDKKAASDFFNR